MPTLAPTDYFARVTWLGSVERRGDTTSRQRADLPLHFDGPQGEAHGGRTRKACSRTSAQHPEGTEIANTRQLTVVAAEDLAVIARRMGLETLNPSWLGATLVLDGIVDFSHVPPSSRLQGPDGATLVVDMEIRPCHRPGAVIAAATNGRVEGHAFRGAAHGRRGVTAWVERPGTLRLGDWLRLHVPDQPRWVRSA